MKVKRIILSLAKGNISSLLTINRPGDMLNPLSMATKIRSKPVRTENEPLLSAKNAYENSNLTPIDQTKKHMAFGILQRIKDKGIDLSKKSKFF